MTLGLRRWAGGNQASPPLRDTPPSPPERYR